MPPLTTERIHPGGKPAQSQPYESIPERYGKIKFRRQVLKSKDDKNAENLLSTEDDIETPGQGDTEEEEVDGQLYSWASNICHLHDTKVKVEDLSDRDVSSQLARDMQKLLSKALKNDYENTIAYSKTAQLGESVVEVFTVIGPLGEWRVYRKTYQAIDVRQKRKHQYSELAIAKRISKEAEAKAGPAPSAAELKHVASQILVRNGGKLLMGGKDKKWQILLHQAQEVLHIHRHDASYRSKLAKEMEKATQGPAEDTTTQELIDLVEKELPVKKHFSNTFHQSIIDDKASKACEEIKGFDIVVLRDCNHELICGVVTSAIQKLLPAGTADKMSTAAEAFAWRYPYKRPDELRHPTNQALHLRANPNKDVHSKECEQPHFAVCGVEHYGLHHELGHGNRLNTLSFQKFSAIINPNRKPLENSAWKEEFPKLRGGVYGVAEKVSRLSLKAWDPELYEEYLEAREYLPESLKMRLATTGDNLYGYMAQLFDPLTEGHTDSTDWAQGMAALTCFGEFTGGDLVLKELGVRIAFPSGSNCHLRGHELYHYINGYKGIRHSLVLTNKESVRKSNTDFQSGLEEAMAKVAELQSKDPKDWSGDDEKLMEASGEGRNAILELIFRSEKEKHEKEKKEKREKRKADGSQGKDPNQPPKKKTTKTSTSQ